MVVASLWGNRIYSILAALGRLEKNDESFFLFKIVLVQNFWRGKELNKFCPSNRSNATFAFAFSPFKNS